jgi:hypothetical protein
MQSILELQELTPEVIDSAPGLELRSIISTVSCTWVME